MNWNKVAAGDRLRIPFDLYNTLVDVATDWLTRELTFNAPRPGESDQADAVNVVKVKNNSGADRARYDVLALGAPIIGPADNLAEFRRRPTFLGTTPTSSSWGKFCVLLEPIKSAKIGRAAIGGTIVTKLDNPSTPPPHPFCDIAASSNTLTTGWHGAGEVLATVVHSGTRWGLVRLGNYQAPTYAAKTKASIAAGGSGNIGIYWNGTEEETVTGHFDWMDGTDPIPNAVECLAVFFRDANKWRITNAKC